MLLPLTLNGPSLSPEGFFFLSESRDGRLLFLPGLVSIHEGEKRNTANVLVVNPTETHVQLKKGSEVGSIYQLNDNDVDNTELIELSDQSLIQPCSVAGRKGVPPSSRAKERDCKVSATLFG